MREVKWVVKISNTWRHSIQKGGENPKGKLLCRSGGKCMARMVLVSFGFHHTCALGGEERSKIALAKEKGGSRGTRVVRIVHLDFTMRTGIVFLEGGGKLALKARPTRR